MENIIKQHTAQAEYRSSIDEIMRGQLTKKEITDIIQLSYNEIMRLEIENQQIINASNNPDINKITTLIEEYENAGYYKAVSELKNILLDPRDLKKKLEDVQTKRPYIL